MKHTIAIIKRHWKPLLGLNSVLLAATVYAATIYANKSFQPVWKANAKLNVSAKVKHSIAEPITLDNLPGSRSDFAEEINLLKVQSTIMTSKSVFDRLLVEDPEKSAYSQLREYKDLFKVIPQKNSTILELEAEGSSPELALQRVETLIDVYQKRLDEMRRHEAKDREQFAQKELEKAYNNLLKTQNDLNKFQQSARIADSGAQIQQLIEAIGKLQIKQTQTMAEVRAKEAEAKVATTYLNLTPQQAINSLRLAENKEYQAIRSRLAQVEIELAEARSKYTNETPQIKSLGLKQQELRRQLKQRIAVAIPGIDVNSIDTTLGSNREDSRIGMITEFIKTQVALKGLEQQASELQNQLKKLNSELNLISQNQAQLSELQRKYDIAESIYKDTLAQVKEAKFDSFNSYPNIQLIDEPTLVSQPINTKRWSIVVGGLLTSIVGSIGIVLLLESRKPLLSPKDLQQVELELPVLGRISRLKCSEDGEWNLDASAEVECQRLASAISFLKLENHRLMVTSATSGEGKTTIALGTAAALAKLGFRILVVDGDLQRAELSRRLGHLQTERTANLTQLVVPVHPGLDLMPAPPIQADKIGKFALRSFEQRLRLVQESGKYDYVIVDSAPVSLASETALMSAAVHNVLFVVRSGTSDRYSVLDSLEQLKRHNAEIKGLAINGTESRSESYRDGSKRELLDVKG